MFFRGLLFFMATVLSCQADQKLTEVVEANDKFSSNIYKNLASSQDGNIIFSGLSANLILSLLTDGAKGDTRSELINGLNLVKDEAQRNDGYKQLSSRLNINTEDLKILAANKIYPAQGFPVSESFRNTAVGDYNAEIENLNYKNTGESAGIINKWVEGKTNGKIQNLIDASQLEENTKMVLVNALYFSGRWVEPFYRPRKGKFFTTETESKEIDLMQNEIEAKYRHCGFFQANFLELPFRGGNVSITFVLPDSHSGFKRLEENFGEVVEVHAMKEGTVSVTLPKFRIESKLNFKPELEKLGVQKVFTDSADLSGISPQGNLKVDFILQKAFIDVNENGVEATAATAVELTPFMSPDPVFTFIADHPFLYYIRDKNTGVVLFGGRFKG